MSHLRTRSSPEAARGRSLLDDVLERQLLRAAADRARLQVVLQGKPPPAVGLALPSQIDECCTSMTAQDKADFLVQALQEARSMDHVAD